MSKKRFSGLRLILMVPVVVLLAGGLIIGGRALQEPGEVRTLKRQEVAQTDEGHQEYYFGLLNENEQRGYREILEGIRSFEDKFYLSLSGDNEIDRVYHAVLKDHPELFWVHNREKVSHISPVTTFPAMIVFCGQASRAFATNCTKCSE